MKIRATIKKLDCDYLQNIELKGASRKCNKKVTHFCLDCCLCSHLRFCGLGADSLYDVLISSQLADHCSAYISANPTNGN